MAYSPRGDANQLARALDAVAQKDSRRQGAFRDWRAWSADQVKKYQWDIDPEDWKYPTIHGLRGTGILLRYGQGYDVDQIANDVGMSRQMVEHYMRFHDQMEVAASGRARLRLVDGD